MDAIFLCSGYSHVYGRDGYIDAYEEAMGELPEDMEEWLDELGSENYEIVDDYEWDGEGTVCELRIKLEPEYAMAFKLKWQ